MEFLVYYGVIKKRLWVILAVCLVGVVVGVAQNVSQAPMYRTTTTLMINPALPNPLLPYQASLSVESLAASYTHFLKTRSFAQLVADAMAPEVSLEQALSSISGQLVPGTQFFRISAIASSPELAQAMANTTARVFIQENVARQKSQREQAAARRGQETRVALEERRLVLQEILEGEVSYYQAQSASLRERIAALETLPAEEAVTKEILSLRRELMEVQVLGMRAITTLGEMQLKQPSSNGTPINTAVVIDEAVAPASPISQNVERNLLYALALSIVLGVGVVFTLEYLDYTFKKPEELEQAYGKAILGAVGRVEGGSRGEAAREKVVITQPKSSIAEAFRSLRTNLQFASLDKPIRSLLVTSSAPLEGKTFVATNLAIAVAQTGMRVVLVDGDLRRPTLHRIFGLSNDLGGAQLLLESQAEIAPCLRSTEVAGLKVLCSGSPPPNPSEILSSKRMGEIVRRLLESAELVIIDSPPVGVVTDAAILASQVDAVLQIVRAGLTRRDMVLKGRDSLATVGGRVLGPVLNMVRDSDGVYPYSYYLERGSAPLIAGRERVDAA